jgi:predicted nucleotidyltransferase
MNAVDFSNRGQVGTEVRERVARELRAVERQYAVRVLYACESGSRAWGFASPDSDYDVRFLYVHEPQWYLGVGERRDVIEAMLPGDVDLAGWDLRKTLGLLRKSNPALLEWLRSPVVYAVDEAFLAEFRGLCASYYAHGRVYAHYLHMAQGNWRAYLQGAEVNHKKYLYVLRPALACRWLQRGLGQPPMEFAPLVERLLAADRLEVREAIAKLLERKAAAGEMARGPRDPVLHAFLEAELADLEERLPAKTPSLPPLEELNAFFLRQLGFAA